MTIVSWSIIYLRVMRTVISIASFMRPENSISRKMKMSTRKYMVQEDTMQKNAIAEKTVPRGAFARFRVGSQPEQPYCWCDGRDEPWNTHRNGVLRFTYFPRTSSFYAMYIAKWQSPTNQQSALKRSTRTRLRLLSKQLTPR
jgi:hypothetical protein